MRLFHFFNHFHSISKQEFDFLLAKCIIKQYAKNELITMEGSIQKDLLLVEEGVQMSYYNNEGKIHVMAFTYPPAISGIPDSFFSQQPSQYNLLALTDSVFRTISFQKLNELFDEVPPIERLFRKMTETVLSGMIHRHLELHAMTIEQRFRLFAQRSPHLFQLVPHKYIANYLHIDPTNFSKLFNSIKI
jgi:CRP-like cAMP-binding protein